MTSAVKYWRDFHYVILRWSDFASRATYGSMHIGHHQLGTVLSYSSIPSPQHRSVETVMIDPLKPWLHARVLTRFKINVISRIVLLSKCSFILAKWRKKSWCKFFGSLKIYRVRRKTQSWIYCLGNFSWRVRSWTEKKLKAATFNWEVQLSCLNANLLHF